MSRLADAAIAVVTGDTLVEFVFGQAVEELGEDGATFVHKEKTAGWRWNTLGKPSQN